MRVYADNAATTKLSPAAKEAMLPYFDEIYGNPSTLYTLGQEAAEHLLACRTEIAQLIGAADPREIVFTSGGSEADNQAIISAARSECSSRTRRSSSATPGPKKRCPFCRKRGVSFNSMVYLPSA